MAEVWIRIHPKTIVRTDEITTISVRAEQATIALRGVKDPLPLLTPGPGEPQLPRGFEAEVLAAIGGAQANDARVVLLAPQIHPDGSRWVFATEQALP
ncbi:MULTISPECIES: hypothetical protein [Actinomadura]|uniref:Uncharacterized protein n=1 Tax=Actinomadura yumaensis TaxID=111807 RepID=A0ABW2CFM8_9ACTN|nr:hypothetical protein [Actinomadura sp. J1-007]MWK38403.1 hypothetical protein [Actinomadura sp. J1-007]